MGVPSWVLTANQDFLRLGFVEKGMPTPTMQPQSRHHSGSWEVGRPHLNRVTGCHHRFLKRRVSDTAGLLKVICESM
jgi:hypothetical protein